MANWQRRATKINTEMFDENKFTIAFWGTRSGQWICQIMTANCDGQDAHEVDSFAWPTMREAFIEAEREFLKMVKNREFSRRRQAAHEAAGEE